MLFRTLDEEKSSKLEPNPQLPFIYIFNLCLAYLTRSDYSSGISQIKANLRKHLKKESGFETN